MNELDYCGLWQKETHWRCEMKYPGYANLVSFLEERLVFKDYPDFLNLLHLYELEVRRDIISCMREPGKDNWGPQGEITQVLAIPTDRWNKMLAVVDAAKDVLHTEWVNDCDSIKRGVQRVSILRKAIEGLDK